MRPTERLMAAGIALGRRVAEDAHMATSRAWTGATSSDRAAAPSPNAAALDLIRRESDAALTDVVLPFWATHGWDDEHGGFILELGPGGQRLGPTDKYLVGQARLVWTMAAACRHGLTTHGYLDLAGRGARFLVEHMWDPEAGGFVWAVAANGTPIVRDKRTYGQAFAIYALAEYALASGESWATDWAARTLDVLVLRAADEDLGFFERFDGDWRLVPGPAARGKTVDVHLHIIEALTPLVEATGDRQHAARLGTVLDLVLGRGVDERHQCAIDDRLDRDWRWRPSWRRPIGVSYGHAAELAWLAGRAADVLGASTDRVRGVALGLIDHALRFGFDHEHGGIATLGPPAGAVRHAWYAPPAWRTKRWWEQAEMLVATLAAYEWTGERRYLSAFEKQFAWVRPHQLDESNRQLFDPAVWGSHDLKDPYHGARALMEVSRRLSRGAMRSQPWRLGNTND